MYSKGIAASAEHRGLGHPKMRHMGVGEVFVMFFDTPCDQCSILIPFSDSSSWSLALKGQSGICVSSIFAGVFGFLPLLMPRI